ncbi:WD40/YVTN/BNR-like repeat-containing protein [Burkholderia sp. YIM B11467]
MDQKNVPACEPAEHQAADSRIESNARRHFLLSMGGLGAATLLSACGGADGGGPLAASVKAAAAGLGGAAAQPAYTWGNVRVVAGGYVSGLVAHPWEGGLIYARTDIGGAYRYDATSSTWIPLNDWTPPSTSHWMGIESIAVDPGNPNMLYMVVGLYTSWWAQNGAVLVSSDRGATFTSYPLGLRVGGNQDGRQVGERLQVDPNHGSTLFYGSSNASSQPAANGLWKSADSGQTWARVSGFNALSSDDTGAGVAFVAFDPRSGGNGSPSQILFAGVSTGTAVSTLYRSGDGGVTWNAVAGGPASPMMPQRGLIGPDRNLYVTYGNVAGPNSMTAGQVWKYSVDAGTWENITPTAASSYPSGFSGLAVDPWNPGVAVVMTMDHWWPSDTMYRTGDGGKTWTDVGAQAVRDASLAPWLTDGNAQAGFGNWGQVMIDPSNIDHAFYSTGATIWSTTNLTDADRGLPTRWTIGANGVEETAVLALASPTAGAPLISGLGDIGGFVHTDLTQAPKRSAGNINGGNGTGVDFARNAPAKMVLVGTGVAGGSAFGAVSQDGGTTWTAFANQAGSSKGAGTVALSADGRAIVWAPSDVAPVYSTNNGASWNPCVGAWTNTPLPVGVQVLSDGLNANLLYAWDGTNGVFYGSGDQGATWQMSAKGLPANGKASTVTGIQGQIWLATSSGLYRSSNSGWTWDAFQPGVVTSAISVGFGKAAPGASYPAIYLAGTVNGVIALFRSIDQGATWVQINDAQHQWGGYALVVGDPRTFGTVYVSPNSGRGIVYGTSST